MTICHTQGQYIFWQPSLVTCCWLHVTLTQAHPTAHWGVSSHLLDATHKGVINTENAACWLHVTLTQPHPTAHWGVSSHLLDATHKGAIHTENAASTGSVV